MWPSSIGTPPVAMGAMRLSTESGRNADRSIAVLHAAFAGGVTLVDTADAYALDDADVGHNERLIARAVSSWAGDRTTLTVITKGGLTRPQGRWVPDGRARHLIAACRASCAALGVPRLPLYQLHAPDPRVAWETSVRALATIADEGLVDAVGLCNVTVGQIEAARTIVDIATVQVELGPWNHRHVDSGVVAYCLEHGIRLLAFRPFGGVKGRRRVARDPVLGEIASRHAASRFEVVLAWMCGLAPHIVPLPGPTSEETARSCGRARDVILTQAEQETLDRHLPLGSIRTLSKRTARPTPAIATATGDIVLVMGLPGAGKTTFAMDLVSQGYERLNRDEAGGSLRELLPQLEGRLRAGASRIVLDNTYLSRASRAGVIATAGAHGRGVRAVWLGTAIEDAQLNAVWRMVRAHGRLLSPEEMRAARDPASFGPGAQFRAQRELEPPQRDEGFASVEVRTFAREPDAAASGRAIILWCDGVLRRSRSGAPRPQSIADMEVISSRRERLARRRADGWRVIAMSWEPEITERGTSAAEVEAGLARLAEELAVDIDFQYCPHGGGPPVCWCRKPLPGLGVLAIDRHRLDPAQCIYVGATGQDRSFARRLGFRYAHVDDFFSGE